MKAFVSTTAIVLLLILATTAMSRGEILLAILDKANAEELGITMKSKAGKESVKVWLEFKKEGALKEFNYAEFRMNDGKGNFLVTAMLKPHPVVHGQSKDLVSVAFTTTAEHLANCSFTVVNHAVLGGDGYILNVADFLDLKD